MFTPNGLEVLVIIFLNVFSKSSGRIGPAASTPIPPAFDTAMISAAFDDAQLMAAWKIGCSMPRSSVIRVFISSFFALDELARLAGKLRKHGFKNLSFLRRQASVERLVTLGGRADQSLVEPAPALAERELHAARVARVGRALHHPAPGEPRYDAAHLALVDAGGMREVVERKRLGRRAQQRDRAPPPPGGRGFAPVTPPRAAREQVRDGVQPIRQQVADHGHLSRQRKASRLRRAAGCRKRTRCPVSSRSAVRAAQPAGPHRAPDRRRSRKTSPTAAAASAGNRGSGG